MNNSNEKYLPVGTVVLLKGASKKLMITGFCAVSENNPNKIYDYSCCLYPEGTLSSTRTGVFNHNQIKQIFHYGYVDDEEKKFKANLNLLLKSGELMAKNSINQNSENNF